MEAELLKSKNIEDYEILIRKRGETEYASYCPQLNLMLKGLTHESVKQMMKEQIQKYISNLP